tara:strand:+ start:59 stop:379 length:321 start_codon:yes stop_codon:yes gene_type:complete
MDQLILLFLQRGKEKQHDSLLPYLSLSSIITYTYTRNKRIAQNRATSPLFILSENTQRTKRIKKAGSILEQYLHSGVRYINDGDYKGQYKNAYQGVATRMTGGNRP